MAMMRQEAIIASLKYDGNSLASPHFKIKEFACHDGSDFIIISKSLLDVLESIREHFGNKPVIINSGYRTPDYNKKCGGAKDSQHMRGTAADIHIKGVTPKQIADYAGTIKQYCLGIGVYKDFTHIDTRGFTARWTG